MGGSTSLKTKLKTISNNSIKPRDRFLPCSLVYSESSLDVLTSTVVDDKYNMFGHKMFSSQLICEV